MVNEYNESLLNELHKTAQELSEFHGSGFDSVGVGAYIVNRAWARWKTLKEIAEEKGIFNPEDFDRYSF